MRSRSFPIARIWSTTKSSISVAGSDYAKERLRWVLATVTGEASVVEACAALGIKESRFHELRALAMSGATAYLEPRRRGRPRREEDPAQASVEELLAKVAELEEEVVIQRTRAVLARDLPHLVARERGKNGESATKRPEQSGARVGRRKLRGSLVVRPQDARADEPDT